MNINRPSVRERRENRESTQQRPGVTDLFENSRQVESDNRIINSDVNNTNLNRELNTLNSSIDSLLNGIYPSTNFNLFSQQISPPEIIAPSITTENNFQLESNQESNLSARSQRQLNRSRKSNENIKEISSNEDNKNSSPSKSNKSDSISNKDKINESNDSKLLSKKRKK